MEYPMAYQTGRKPKGKHYVNYVGFPQIGVEIDDEEYEKLSDKTIKNILSELPEKARTYNVLIYLLRRMEKDAGFVKFNL